MDKVEVSQVKDQILIKVESRDGKGDEDISSEEDSSEDEEEKQK
jgi:hypothetical protein